MKVTLQKCVSMENISHIYISENPIGNIFFIFFYLFPRFSTYLLLAGI